MVPGLVDTVGSIATAVADVGDALGSRDPCRLAVAKVNLNLKALLSAARSPLAAALKPHSGTGGHSHGGGLAAALTSHGGGHSAVTGRHTVSS